MNILKIKKRQYFWTALRNFQVININDNTLFVYVKRKINLLKKVFIQNITEFKLIIYQNINLYYCIKYYIF